jgi:predicted DNA binding protein
MTTVAEFTADADTFPFGVVFERFPSASVELERIVPAESSPIPYVWLRNVPAEALGEVDWGHEHLASVELIDSVGDEHLLRMTWSGEYEGLIPALVDSGVTLLSAIGDGEQWTLEVRGERDEVAGFRAACEEQGVSIHLRSLQSLGPGAPMDEYGLTEPQREALVAAHRLGYFDHPRRATLADVAEDLGISRQALSSRLRRGYRSLVENTVAVG